LLRGDSNEISNTAPYGCANTKAYYTPDAEANCCDDPEPNSSALVSPQGSTTADSPANDEWRYEWWLEWHL
jgi:hypothetical protein